MFGNGPDAKIYIGSADMMTRNTEKRVEVACPVYDTEIKKRLLHCLKVMLSDNLKAREMAPDWNLPEKEGGRKADRRPGRVHEGGPECEKTFRASGTEGKERTARQSDEMVRKEEIERGKE